MLGKALIKAFGYTCVKNTNIIGFIIKLSAPAKHIFLQIHGAVSKRFPTMNPEVRRSALTTARRLPRTRLRKWTWSRSWRASAAMRKSDEQAGSELC